MYVAGADQFFIIATYEEIASDVNGLSKAPWLLTGYNLGYCVALPVVRANSRIFGFGGGKAASDETSCLQNSSMENLVTYMAENYP